MELNVKYQGRVATVQDVAFIEELIARNPDISRRALSREVCKAWNWVQPNGMLCDMVCRGFMLRLESSGYIKLPPRKCSPNNPLVVRSKPPKLVVDQTPIHTRLSEIQPVELRQVRRTPLEKLCDSLIEQYHYLGYTHPVGEHLKYIAFADERPVACFTFSSATRHLKCRDRFIGWGSDIRRKRLHLIVYNSRFLILNWVRVPHLASHLLSLVAKQLPVDWERIYNHPIFFLETFVDTERFKGTVYKAANWLYLGNTTGRGKNDHTNKPNRSIKAIFGYPLCKNFQQELCRDE